MPFKCAVCNKEYKNPLLASACKESHGHVYVPIYKADLQKLLKAIYSDDMTHVPERLFTTIKKYASVKDGNENDMPDMP